MVTPTTDVPTYDITLSDGSNTLGLILVDSRGNRDITNLRRFSLVRTPLKTSSGESKYADLEPPYASVAQDDWTGGRAQETFEDDKSRYFDSYRIDTLKSAGVILGGQESYGTNYRDAEIFMPGSVTWQSLTSTQRYLGLQFTADSTFTAVNLELWVKRVGTPGTLSAAIYTNSGGDPDSAIGTPGSVSVSTITDTVSVLYKFTISAALTATTVYHVVIYGFSTDSTTNHWEVATSANHEGRMSSDGSAWSTASNKGIYYRVTASDTAQKFKFFEYKRAIYAISQPDNNGTSTLYINGDRGAADSNSGALGTLVDASKSWDTDEWAESIVLITAGPGSAEARPWREITSNTSTALTVSGDANWLITHTTATEYVIIKSNKWTSTGTAMGGYVTDVAVAGDFVYFARGEGASLNILRYRAYNNGGTWTVGTDAETNEATFLATSRHPTLGNVLYGGLNNQASRGVCVWRMAVPISWNDLYRNISTALETDSPWADRTITNVTQRIASGNTRIAIAEAFTTGIAAVKNLDTAVDLTSGLALGFKIHSDVATSSGDLQLVVDDAYDLGEQFQPTGFKHLEIAAGVPTYTDLDDAIDEHDSTYATTSITTAGGIMIFGSEPFNQIYFDIGSTPNAAVETFTAQYSTRNGMTSVTIADGTVDGGATLAVDGSITFTQPQDWESVTIDSTTGYVIHLNPSGNLTADVTINQVYLTRQNNQTFDIPAIPANEYIWAAPTDSFFTSHPGPDASSIKSVGLKVVTDLGAQNVTIDGGLHLVDLNPRYIDLPNDAPINGLEIYSGSPEDPRENLWVLTEAGIYEIQSQNDDAPVALPLKELRELRGIDNGAAHTTNDVYLYFNLQNKLERYFNRNLDDIGPDRDAGLPSDRQGAPLTLVSYPGRILIGIDGGTSNYSSVLALSGETIHEVYRAPRTGARIRGMGLQTIPGSSTSRLWINQGADIIWVPISLDPYRDSDYRFIHEGTITSSYFHANLQDVIKLWKSLKIFAENLSASNYYIEADYRTDGTSTWTAISGDFDTVPTEEINFSTATPPNVSARRLQIRLHFLTNDNTNTPRLKATVIESAAFIADKAGFNFNFLLGAKELAMIDRQGNVETNDVDTIYDRLVTWRLAQALTLRTISVVSDNKTVFISDGPSTIMIGKELDTENGESQEKHIGQITIQEL